MIAEQTNGGDAGFGEHAGEESIWRKVGKAENERAQEQDVAGPSERRCEGMNWEESEGPALRYGAGHGGDRDTTDR